jgi:hypothetical protein
LLNALGVAGVDPIPLRLLESFHELRASRFRSASFNTIERFRQER